MQKKCILFGVLLYLATGPALADEVIEEYTTFIGEADLYNSSGMRLQMPWQIIRQDRANFHRFRVRDRGDETDSFFASTSNRDLMERMVRAGRIEPIAGRAIVGGNVFIHVQVIRAPGISDYLMVTVE